MLALEVSFVLALALASVAMIRRNHSNWRPLFFSAAFVSYSVWAMPTLDALALPGALLPASGEARLLYELFGVPAFWLLALPIPLGLTIAMLRHHLFDVEVIISITLVYGILTAVLAGIFEVTLVTVQHVLLVFTHVEESRLAYFATAMVMATFFDPLKRRIDALVDSIFFKRDVE